MPPTWGVDRSAKTFNMTQHIAPIKIHECHNDILWCHIYFIETTLGHERIKTDHEMQKSEIEKRHGDRIRIKELGSTKTKEYTFMRRHFERSIFIALLLNYLTLKAKPLACLQ